MIAAALLKKYVEDTSDLAARFRTDPALARILIDHPTLNKFTGRPEKGIIDLLMKKPELEDILRSHRELLPLLREGEEVHNLLNQYPDLHHILAAHSGVKDLLTGRPSFLGPVFLADSPGNSASDSERVALHDSVVRKAEEFARRLEQGSRLPRFTITRNSKTGFREVDVVLATDQAITAADALRSLEDVLAEAFLSYADSPVREGYLAEKFAHRIRRGEREVEVVQTGMDLLFSSLTSLSISVFGYVLWLLSGRADGEVGRLLDGIHRLLAGLEETRPPTELVRRGHVLSIEAVIGTGGNRSIEQFLRDMGARIDQALTGRPDTSSAAPDRSSYLLDLYREQDVHFDLLKNALQGQDYLECDRLVRYCTSNQYLSHKRLVGQVLVALNDLGNSEPARYELVNIRGVTDFRKVGTELSYRSAITSVLAAACRAVEVAVPDAEKFGDQFDEETHRRVLREIGPTYARLKNHRPFQLHRDFLAAAREFPGFDESAEREWFELRHPLTDLLQVLLQRRYDELVVILDVISSPDYRILKRHLHSLHDRFSACQTAYQAQRELPDPVIEQGSSWPMIVFSDQHLHSLTTFSQCLALQLYGVLTGDTVANTPSLWLTKVLSTHSAIDNFLASLWDAILRSPDEMMVLITDMRNNLLEYLIQYKHQNRKEKSKLKERRIDLTAKATRDISVFARAGTTILVVDDMLDVLELNSILLEQNGCKVIKATNGVEALEAINSAPNLVDLVVSDIRMPMMDGLELTRRIKQTKPETPVILCSGLADANWKAAGADDFVAKPYSVSDLLEKILELLAHRDPARYAEVSA